ncbi:hypothetical protein PTMSG1_02996 [Pyrenophora teres f. maculata]|nr:hypothetical protein PTMSG1_02996 [Pyrenophora teres f. maculata]
METTRASRFSVHAFCIVEKEFHAMREHYQAQQGHLYADECFPLSTLYTLQPQESSLNQPAISQTIQKMSSPQSTTDAAVTNLQGLTLKAHDSTSDSEDDYYSSSSEEFEDSDDEEFERAVSYSVDLVSQENAVNKAPVFTRSLFEVLKTHVDQLNQEFSLPPAQRTLNEIYAPGPEGKQPKIWDFCGKTGDNSIQVHYFARVELHPDFQRLHGSQTNQIRLMRRYNQSSSSQEKHLTFPYAIATYQRRFNTEHRSSKAMKQYWQALLRTKDFWFASSSRLLLQDLFTSLAKTHAPITKIVCFGLGAINLDKAWYQSAVQYMAMFTIIGALEKQYKETDPSRAGIKLLLQDPNYETKDYELISKLWPGKKEDLVFVSDPDGLLAIDAGTIVVSAYLPIQVPLVQIIADLFYGEPGSGPAMIIGDDMNLDPTKTSYSLVERGAPHVARFFDQRYEKIDSGFGDYALEEEFMDDVLGEGWMDRKRYYWLNSMELWARKVSGEP